MAENPSARLSTGVRGLGAILYGGFVPQRTDLVRGQAGTGKTTLGLHFLAAGAAKNEPVLLITFGESERQLRQNAAAVGFDMAHYVELGGAIRRAVSVLKNRVSDFEETLREMRSRNMV